MERRSPSIRIDPYPPPVGFEHTSSDEQTQAAVPRPRTSRRSPYEGIEDPVPLRLRDTRALVPYAYGDHIVSFIHRHRDLGVSIRASQSVAADVLERTPQ